MLVDDHEPDNIAQLMAQSLQVLPAPLNQNGMADYAWYTYLHTLEQAERKQVPELLGTIDKVEYQLGRQLMDAPDSLLNQYLIIEGVAQGIPEGIQTWKVYGGTYRKSTRFKISLSRYEAYLIALSRAGVVIFKTESWEDTAITLVQLEKSAQHESSILNRHLKIRPDFRPNAYVEQLMGIKDIGPELAVRLIEIFGTPYKVYTTSPGMLADVVPGMGIKGAVDLLRKIGRDDV